MRDVMETTQREFTCPKCQVFGNHIALSFPMIIPSPVGNGKGPKRGTRIIFRCLACEQLNEGPTDQATPSP